MDTTRELGTGNWQLGGPDGVLALMATVDV